MLFDYLFKSQFVRKPGKRRDEENYFARVVRVLKLAPHLSACDAVAVVMWAARGVGNVSLLVM
jgi:hypothetical protein